MDSYNIKRRWLVGGIVLTVAFTALAGCTPQTITVRVTAPPETVVVTPSPAPPSSLPPETKDLTVCLVGEPDTLYLYGGSGLPATRHVMEALYDGPVDHSNYGHQPVILEKLPSIADDEAEIRLELVREGDRVLNAAGEVVELSEGTRIRPRGCYTDGCAVEHDGGSAWMERLEVTFTLREAVTWSDGEPLTAADSVFGFEVASDPATPGYRELTERTAQYRALDERRLEWIGIPGFIDETYFLNIFPPLPRHQLEDRSPASLMQASETRRYPLGWGPFVVDEWDLGQSITLVPNPHYFRASEGLPHLDRVTYHFMADGADVVAGLFAGDCDVGTHDAGLDSWMSLLVQAEERGLLNVHTAPGARWEHIEVGVQPVDDYRPTSIFRDVKVRQALAHCLDRQTIVDEVTYGRGQVLDGYLPPEHPLYAGEGLRQWAHDPIAGRMALEETGWLDEDEDGVREAVRVEDVRDDTPLALRMLVSGDDSVSLEIARMVEAQLADCGIRVDVEPRSDQALYGSGPDAPLFGRRFDLAEIVWEVGARPPCEHYLSSEIPSEGRWSGDNPSGYSNIDYDDACQAALEALPGMSDYAPSHRRAQVIFSQDLPAIPLFMRLRVGAAKSHVLNYAMDATAPSELWNIEMLDVRATPELD